MSQSVTGVRNKSTDISNALLPVSSLLDGKSAILNYVDLDGQSINLDFGPLAEFDPFLIPMPIDREGYGTVESSPYFWASGHADWLNVESAMDRFLTFGRSDTKTRLLDFGCATGRFLRHAWAFGRQDIDLWGCDFAHENVQ